MKYKTILILFVIALLSSITLSFLPASETCNIENTCEAIQKSEHNFFNGIKNSYYGMAIFSFLTFLTFSHIKHPRKYKKHIIHIGIILGSIIAVYFLYLQQFVIGSYCKFCIILDISLLIAFAIAICTWKK